MLKVWHCTITINENQIPNGADFPVRTAATDAITAMGLHPEEVYSFWDNSTNQSKLTKAMGKLAELEAEISELKSENEHLKSLMRQDDWELEEE